MPMRSFERDRWLALEGVDVFTDARALPNESVIESDLCVIGSGPAGLTIARTLVESGLRVTVLESGGTRISRFTRKLARPSSVGDPWNRWARGRAFGGTSNYWETGTGLRCRPLDPIDFERRDAVPYSGWPFDADHLAPYYARAHALVGLPAPDYRPERWEQPGKTALPLDPADAHTAIFQFAPNDCFLRFRDEASRSDNLQVVLFANVASIETAEDPSVVSGVRVAATGTGLRHTVRARAYVLATGGIENARILLASKGTHAEGLGNSHDLVGRYFADHFSIDSGFVRPQDDSVFGRLGIYSEHGVNGTKIQGMVTIAADALRREGLLNTAFWLTPMNEVWTRPGVHSARAINQAFHRNPRLPHLRKHLRNVARDAAPVASAMARRYLPLSQAAPGVLNVRAFAEQAPNPHSRVTLQRDLDPYGVPKAQVDWRITEDDRASIRRAQGVLDRALQRAGIGRIEGMLGDEDPPATLIDNYHHIGTTRMHVDPRQGVVDEQCRVHDVANLFVAGSSVFPTGGYVNPTLSIIALAIRLSDHLRTSVLTPARVPSVVSAV
jgi:choline dehydrogenase-like flavoprotein